MADRYWVGGTGTWDATAGTKWALTSGGAGGQAVPTSADDVYIDSGSGVVTVTTSAASTCRSLFFVSGSGSFAGTFAGTTAISVAGSLTLSASMSMTYTGTITFTATTAQTITSNGVALNTPIIFNGVGGSWQLVDNLTTGATRVTNLTNGSVDLNNKIFTSGLFNSNNSNTRSIAFGTGKIVLTGNATIVVETSTQTGFSYTGSGLIESNYSGSTGTRTFNVGRTTATEANALSLSITAGADTISLTNSDVFKNLNFTGFTGTLGNNTRMLFGNFVISSGMTCTAGANATTFAATSGTQQVTTNGVILDFPLTQNNPGATLQIQDNLTMGSTRTLTLTAGILDLVDKTLSAGLFNSNNSNTRSIAFGTGNITTTGSGTVWTTATPTNFSRTGTPTVNISNNSATATTVSTGAMTEAQSLNFSYTTGTYTLTDTAAVYRSVNFTGFAGTIPNSVRTIFGSLTLGTGVTLTAGANVTTFASTAAGNTITSAGKTQDYPITFNGISGSWAFQDALTQGSTRAFTVTNGTVQLKNGVTSTVGAFATSGTNQKFLRSTLAGSQATLSQASGTVNASYLTIQDINATGGATWNARTDLGSKDISNNTGWNFIFIGLQQILKPIMNKILKPILAN